MHWLKVVLRAIVPLLLCGSVCQASDTYFVATNGGHVLPFDSWGKAASNIQDAVNEAGGGDLILVSNGVYRVPTNAVVNQGTNVVSITKAITLRGRTGNPADVIIDGGGSNRCIYMDVSSGPGVAVVESLSVTNGYSYNYGAGMVALATAANVTSLVRNCIISGNIINPSSAVTIYGGGIRADSSAGGYVMVENCIIRGNQVTNGSVGNMRGGGISIGYSSTTIGAVYNCLIESNLADKGAGVLVYYPGSVISNCVIRYNSKNTANTSWGGGIQFQNGGAAYNCLIYSNIGGTGGGIYINNSNTVVENCTVTHNTGNYNGGGIAIRASTADGFAAYNTIVYYNNSPTGSNYWHETTSNPSYFNMCTAPIAGLSGSDNIESEPLFINTNAADYRLQAGSLCINAGLFRTWMPAARDLDGRRRLDAWIRKADIGCYEYTSEGTMLRVK